MSTDTKGHNPSSLDRWLLVKYKKFATKEEIPNTVSSIMMRRVHDKARIHFSIMLMVLTGLGMFTNAMIGKYYSKQGYSIEVAAKEYQEAYNAKKEKELQQEMQKKAATTTKSL